MDYAYQPKRRPGRAHSSTGYPDDDAALPLRGGAWPPARRLNETKTMLASPGPLESMLKTTTETGDIGIFSMGPTRTRDRMRTPYHPTMGPARGPPSRTMSMDAGGRRHLRDDRRGLPSYRDTSSEIISLYGRNHSGPPSFSRSLDDAGHRSYSLTSCSSRLVSDQKSTSTSASRSSGTTDGAPQARPRSPYPYHTRLKRPGVRPISPALTSDGIVDYSTMVEIDRPSYRTVHRSYSRAYPPSSRPSRPRSRSGDHRAFQYLDCDGGSDYMPRGRYALPEIPPMWAKHSQYQSENVPPERNDQNSTITSLVNLYTHSRASSVVRQPHPASRKGSFYYDYSEGFEDTPQRNNTPCEPVSPMPRRSATMNRPMVLDDNCEPLLVNGTLMDSHMLSALDEHPLSGVSSPNMSGPGTEGRAGSEADVRAEEAERKEAPDMSVVQTLVLQQDPCADHASIGGSPSKNNSPKPAPPESDLARSTILGTAAESPSDDTGSAQPDLHTSTEAVDAIVEAMAFPATPSTSDPKDEPHRSDSLGSRSGGRLTTNNPSSLKAIPEHHSRDELMYASRLEESKNPRIIVQASTERPFPRSTDTPGSIDSRLLLDVSFASTADCSGSDFRDTEAGTTPAASQSTRGGCLDEDHDCDIVGRQSVTPTANRKSERFSLQSGLSDLKSFVQNLDNAGLLRDEDTSTFLRNDTRNSILGRLDESPDVSNLLLSTENLLQNGRKPAIALSNPMGHLTDAQRRKFPTDVARVSTSEWLTDITFSSRSSIDNSDSVRDRAKFMRALPSLPPHGTDVRATNHTSKHTVRGALRIPERLSSSRPAQRPYGNMESVSGKRHEIPDSNAQSSHDTSLTYGASGICAILPDVRHWARREISPRTLQDNQTQGPTLASAEQPLMQAQEACLSTPAAPRSTVPATVGMSGRFKSNTVRIKPTTRSIPTARSVGRRASCEANISTSRFTEALPSDKPLPPMPSHKNPLTKDTAHATHPRRLKKSFSNLRMRLTTDSHIYKQESTSHDTRLLVKDGERIGVGIPVTATATVTSRNSSDSNSTEEVQLRGLRHRLARWVKSAKKAVHSCRRLSSSTTGNSSLDTDF